MPATNANTQIQDGFLTHTVNILRVAADQRLEVLDLLLTLEEDLVANLEDVAGKTPLQAGRLTALLKQTQATITDAYGKIDHATGETLAKVAQLEATKTVNVINGAIGAPIASVAMSPEQLAKLAGKTMINGKHPSEWWKDQDAKLQDSFMRQMRLGIAQGEGVDKLTRRVRGTAAKGYTDGLMAVPKHQAEALVRTATLQVSNEARLATIHSQFEAGIVKGVQWLSTLDSRTTPQCRALDGLQWRLPDYAPIGHDKAFPGPIAHWNCRSTQTAVLRSWGELAGPNAKFKNPDGDPADFAKAVQDKLIANGMSPEMAAKASVKTRASMDGQVAAALDFDDWLHGKPQAFQDDLLGRARANLWREGKVTLREMTDQNNNPLTLAQLHELITSNLETAPAKDGENGLSIAERKLLEQSLAAGLKSQAITTHFLDTEKGAVVTVEGIAPTTDQAGAIAKMAGVAIIQNTLEPSGAWDALTVKLMAGTPGFKKAILVDPKGKLLTAQRVGEFGPADAAGLLEAIKAEKRTAGTSAQAFKKATTDWGIDGLKVTSTGAGAVIPPDKLLEDAFPPIHQKPAPFFDPAAEAAAKKAQEEAATAAAAAKAQALEAQQSAAAIKAAQEAKAKADAEAQAEISLHLAQGTTMMGKAVASLQGAGLEPAELLAQAEAKVAADKEKALQAQHLAGYKKAFLADKPFTASQLEALGKMDPMAADAFLADLAEQKKQLGAIAAAKKAADEAAALKAKINAEAQAKIGAALQATKGADFTLGQHLAKLMTTDPHLEPAELLAKGMDSVEAAKANNLKKQHLAAIKKKLLAGEKTTPAQDAVLITLTEDEKTAFYAHVAAESEALEAKKAATTQTAATETATTAAAAAVIASPTPSAPAPMAAPPIPEPKDFPADPLKLTVVKGLGGSTGAELVKDDKGNLYVRKTGNSPAHVREELLADITYTRLGANVPEAKIYETTKGPVKLARFVEGQTLASYLQGATPAQKKAVKAKLQEHFAADALMGNWDVMGTGKDNILVDKKGNVWRIDNGGSFRFRAQGQQKAPANWHEFANELWTMRGIYSTPTLKGLQEGIASSFQKDFAEWFGDVSIFGIARQAKAWDPAALDHLPADLRATVAARLGHIKAIAETAMDLEHGKWKPAAADQIALSSLELRQAGVVNRMASKLTLTPGSAQMKDESGKPFDDLRSKGTSGAAAFNPQDPYADTLLQAIISINAHHKKGGAEFANMAKVNAVLALEPTFKAVQAHPGAASPAQKVLADLYLPWVEKIKAAQAKYNAGTVKGQTGDVLPKFDAAAGGAAVLKVQNPAAARKPQGGASIGQDVAGYIKSLGGNAQAVAQWMGAQGGSSWSANARAMKYFVATSLSSDPEKAFFWHTGGFNASKNAFAAMAAQYGGEDKLRATFSSWIAYIQNVLATTDLPNVDKARRAVLLVRTEEDDVLTSEKVPLGKYGGVHTILRGAVESHDSVGLSSIMGKEVTVQAVPFARVFGLYITERPNGDPTASGSGGPGFLGDSENEYVANTSGVPFVYAGKVPHNGTMLSISAGPAEWKKKLAPGFDLGPDASKWGVPIDHLRDDL